MTQPSHSNSISDTTAVQQPLSPQKIPAKTDSKATHKGDLLSMIVGFQADRQQGDGKGTDLEITMGIAAGQAAINASAPERAKQEVRQTDGSNALAKAIADKVSPEAP